MTTEETPTVWELEKALLGKHLEIRRAIESPGPQYRLQRATYPHEPIAFGTFTECANAAIAYDKEKL